MSDITIIAVSRRHFDKIMELCTEHRTDPDEGREAIYDYFEAHDLDTGAAGVTLSDGEELIFFGPPMFSVGVTQTDDYYGRFDEGDEIVIYSALEDGIAYTVDAAIEGEVEELDDDLDLERIEAYLGDGDIVFSGFDWFESPPHVEHYKQILNAIYIAYLEAVDA